MSENSAARRVVQGPDHDPNEVLQRSPFQSRIDAASSAEQWMSWNGYKTARLYDTLASEYFAIRSSCSVMDLTPMEKYRISGPDALRFLNRLVTRDLSSLAPGRVAYVVWCNDEGQVLDDGTVFHLSSGDYRLCAQHHQLDWLLMSSLGMDVQVRLETHDVAALAVQGPTACAVLRAAGLAGLEALKPFQIVETRLTHAEGTFDVTVSRTGYTGDLGYELWLEPRWAIALWDSVFEIKQRGLFDIRPIGLSALEIVRLEAGFIMPGDDFVTAETAVRSGRTRNPFEVGLGWLVNFEKGHFTGRRALLEQSSRPIQRRLLKLAVDGNKAPVDAFLYGRKGGKQLGEIRVQAWSPIMKTHVATADVRYIGGQPPERLWAQIYYAKELAWQVKWARCTVLDKPLWQHPRRTATPPE
ncbi:MAG: aminomethyltransferase family protein [Pseudomonadota bacterium]